ncbi:RES family NAD+ phosphorylase [Ochrobactrum sp. Marseille-Q0166]|uniref:RES family NAD+ phosphorylase n=1 Tax=Ochrobactrum sp. Marseille-Q0166 TaxID=2761105 RepID=UPI00165609B3|nr:RES family NAD+ phosphorylase [Ochrobactrum sp. Marseille-Q0166]MBC8718147.1 RES family NAD+ phosphorylase [Ochrobactrum sp. Marseille-Q0166]
MAERRARDIELLDVLDAHTGVSFEGDVWRIVRAERDVLEGFASKARWDPGTFDVLYTSLERDGALEEIHFHLSRQPVFPSKLRSVLHRISVRTRRTLKLADLGALAELGITPERYGELSYERSQEIGDAAFFLGFDGILAPSARWDCQNLILFMDRMEPSDLAVLESEPIDWADWRRTRQEKRGR